MGRCAMSGGVRGPVTPWCLESEKGLMVDVCVWMGEECKEGAL